MIIYSAKGRCLFSAGPKLFEAFFRFSMAAKKIDLFEETRHFYKRLMFVFTNCAKTEFSSTIILGSKMKLA